MKRYFRSHVKFYILYSIDSISLVSVLFRRVSFLNRLKHRRRIACVNSVFSQLLNQL